MKYRKVGWKYVLEDDYRFEPLPSGINILNLPTPLITIPWMNCVGIRAGYAWDGASGPTIDTEGTMEATLVHDVLYQLMREGCVSQSARLAADRLLRDMMKRDGVNLIRRWYFYLAVRWFGGNAAKGGSE